MAALNSSIVNSPYPSIPCPKAAPLFNGSSCTYCPKGTYYLIHNLTCYHPGQVSNVSALSASHKVLPYKGITLPILNATIKAIVLPVVECPSLYPLFNGTLCVTCPNGTYYLLKNNTCYVPQVVTNVTQLYSTNTYVNVGLKTLVAINTTITAI